ncbi:hypothetical protein FB45DRAFT_1039373 [Roridomyces roridus]|uniref:Uncharacterized protein n=1 Tax=Roridomyces roridus TaxID=1738132 RepID=A0AAD7B2D5_9AGAR|nr:hypothetical protein FB45DRAFT_1039373 [Roridomyces roridus]
MLVNTISHQANGSGESVALPSLEEALPEDEEMDGLTLGSGATLITIVCARRWQVRGGPTLKTTKARSRPCPDPLHLRRVPPSNNKGCQPAVVSAQLEDRTMGEEKGMQTEGDSCLGDESNFAVFPYYSDAAAWRNLYALLLDAQPVLPTELQHRRYGQPVGSTI